MGNFFSDIKGQKGAVKLLTAQLKSGEFSHGYLFLGPEGTGKEYLAKEFAKYILCQSGKGDDCPSCKRFDTGAHPDFIYIKGDDGIKIDAIRETIERINLSPNLSRYKVVLITKTENMGIEAANALLKTLEEPPHDSVIILTAVSEKSLPQTIVSRAQKIKLISLNKNDILEILQSEYSEKEINKVIDYAAGNVGKAKKMLRSPEEYEKEEKVRRDVAEIISASSVIEKFTVIDDYDKNKNLKYLFDAFAEEVFTALREKLSGSDKPSPLFGLETANLASLSIKILKISENLEYNINLKLAMEEMILDNLIVRNSKG